MPFFFDFCLYVFCRSWVAFEGSWGGLLGGLGAPRWPKSTPNGSQNGLLEQHFGEHVFVVEFDDFLVVFLVVFLVLREAKSTKCQCAKIHVECAS